jgi:hypothetical protein
VPADTPETIPVDEPIVATVVLLLLHVPLPIPSVRVVVWPTQTRVVPKIAVGSGVTVITFVLKQPPLTE